MRGVVIDGMGIRCATCPWLIETGRKGYRHGSRLLCHRCDLASRLRAKGIEIGSGWTPAPGARSAAQAAGDGGRTAARSARTASECGAGAAPAAGTEAQLTRPLRVHDPSVWSFPDGWA